MKYVLIGLAALLVALCSKEKDPIIDENDYLIFGHFYGECMGEECVEMFKLTKDMLYEDTSDSYDASAFKFIPLSREKFDRVKDIRQAIPSPLLKEEEDTFGCPDCVDQGGLYIEVSDGNEIKSWRIDQDKSAVPGYLHDFMDSVNDAIDQL